jgi:hypothetical protein
MAANRGSRFRREDVDVMTATTHHSLATADTLGPGRFRGWLPIVQRLPWLK